MLLLTLLKQARAFGLGLVLATQNPVDLDYKGLSNTGTWFIGRLQTERDKARVMDGLEGAAAGAHFNRAQLERVLAGLGKRRFLLHNVHEDAPVVFDTRWVMSYLTGPMTREQIKSLMASRREEQPASAPAPAGAAAVALPADRPAASSMPVLPPDVPRCYLPLSRGTREGEALVYHPLLIGIAAVSYANARYGVDFAREVSVVTEFAAQPLPVDWENAEVVEIDAAALGDRGVEGARYAELPTAAAKAQNYGKWQRALKRWLRESQALTLLKSPTFKLVSTVGETEGEFRVRLQQLAHEQRDVQAGKLRAKYESKFTTLEDRLRRAEQRIEAEAAQSRQKQLDTAVAVGTAILGAFLGRKRISATAASRVGGAARSAGRMSKEAADVERARESAQAVRQQMRELTARFERDLAALDEAYDAQGEELEDILVRPRSTQMHVKVCAVAWAPYYRDASGGLEAAWK